MATKYILATTNGYEIRSTEHKTLDDAQNAMREAYENYTPDEWADEYEDISYCGTMDAVLYDNGDDVYVWQIIPVEF